MWVWLLHKTFPHELDFAPLSVGLHEEVIGQLAMRKIQGFITSILLATLISTGLPRHLVRAAPSKDISHKLSVDLIPKAQGKAGDTRVKVIVQFKAGSPLAVSLLPASPLAKVTRRLDALN